MAEPQKIKVKFNQLTKARRILFPPKRGKIDAPTQQGVYIISNASGHSVHVGCTPRAKFGLYQRLNDHLYGNSSFVYSFFKGNGNKLREKYFYKYLIVKNARERILLEAYAIGQLCPKHIGEGQIFK